MPATPKTLATEAIFARTLISEAVITRPTLVSDGGSGTTETMTVVATVDAHMRPLSPREIISAAGQPIEWNHILYVLAPCDIGRGDYVAMSNEPNLRYRVIEVTNPSHADFYLAVLCKREVHGG